MRVFIQVFVLIVLLAVACFGCSVVKQDDGTLGLQVGISGKTHDQVQGAIDTASETAGGMSTFFPALLPIATALGVGGGVWRKMKKTVVKKQKPLEMLVGVMEHIKQTDLGTWVRIRKEIKQQYPDLELKATIEETLAELKKQGKLARTNVLGA